MARPVLHQRLSEGLRTGSTDQVRWTTLLLPQAKAGQTPTRLTLSNAAEAARWPPAQLIAHHTAGSCQLATYLEFGTLSGVAPEAAGSLLELARGSTPDRVGKSNGDGDRVEPLICRHLTNTPHDPATLCPIF